MITGAGRPRPVTTPVAEARLLVAIGSCLSVLSACSLFGYSPTPLPSAPPSAAPTTGEHRPHRSTCDNAAGLLRAATASCPSPDDLPKGSTMRKIQDRGRLIAGVSADTYLLGSRNPLNGKIEGFDIDMVKAVAKAIFGDENRTSSR